MSMSHPALLNRMRKPKTERQPKASHNPNRASYPPGNGKGSQTGNQSRSDKLPHNGVVNQGRNPTRRFQCKFILFQIEAIYFTL